MTSFRYFSLGRHAMKAALQLAGVKSGDVVMLPGFICRDLISSITTVGARTVFYDVDKKLNPLILDRSVLPRAIIAVNYFGFPQALEPFKAFSADTGAVVIEDNAHGFLSQDTHGSKLGQRTTLGMTSFRKTLHVLDGATLAITQSPDQIPDQIKIPEQIPYRTKANELRTDLARALTAIERKTGIPTLHMAQTGSRFARVVRKGSALPVSDQSSEYQIPGLANPSQSSIKRMLAVDAEAEVERRRSLYSKLLPEVIGLGVQPIFDALPIGTCPYGLAVYASPKLKRGLAQLSRRYRVTLMTWPELPQEIAQSAPDHYRQVWLINFR